MRTAPRWAGIVGIVGAALLGGAPALAEAPEAPAVSVSDPRGGLYTVKGSFTVPVGDARVWRVLTDYDQLGAIIPSMRSSTLKRTGPRSALVAQDTRTVFLAISRTTQVVLRVEEVPYQRIDFVDVSGQDFELYRGSWRLEKRDGLTRVAYEAQVKPRFMPPVLGTAVMEETVTNLLSSLQSELLRRSAAPSQAG